MDLGTGLALLGSAKLLEKLLGPTADYVGEGAKTWAQRRVENVNRIFSKAAKKLGPKLEAPGSVPPRVLEGVVNNGSYCDDELGAEYFGGVLAASRGTESRDDRAAALNALLSRMSTYQIRTHYIIYSAVRQLFVGKGMSLTYKDRPKLEVFLPFNVYLPAMGFSQEELQRISSIMQHVFFGLQRESLIEQSFLYGSGEDVIARYPKAAEGGGILYQPSVLGAELFLVAHGHASVAVDHLLDPTSNFEIETPVSLPDGARATKAEVSG